jgi:GNAT superfamily N-acetyltransferase
MDHAHPPAVRRLTVRTATDRDLPRLHAIATRAVTELLTGRYYTPAQIRAAEELKMHEVEPDQVDAGTYYVAEVDGAVVAGSGWNPSGQLSRSAKGPTAESGTAAMRASYVDPRWARRGIATLLARTTETAARLSGFRRFETICTPPSAAMRRALGYELVGHEQAQLAHGVTLRLALMRKQLPELPYDAA